MLRRNAIPAGIALCGFLAAGCQEPNKADKTKTAPDQGKVVIESPPPPPPAPELPPPTAAAPTQPPDAMSAEEPTEATARPLPKETHAKKATRKSQTYVVKKGDTLQTIAKKYYGDSGKWRRIYDANRQRIKDPNKVPVGMKLIIP